MIRIIRKCGSFVRLLIPLFSVGLFVLSSTLFIAPSAYASNYSTGISTTDSYDIYISNYFGVSSPEPVDVQSWILFPEDWFIGDRATNGSREALKAIQDSPNYSYIVWQSTQYQSYSNFSDNYSQVVNILLCKERITAVMSDNGYVTAQCPDGYQEQIGFAQSLFGSGGFKPAFAFSYGTVSTQSLSALVSQPYGGLPADMQPNKVIESLGVDMTYPSDYTGPQLPSIFLEWLEVRPSSLFQFEGKKVTVTDNSDSFPLDVNNGNWGSKYTISNLDGSNSKEYISKTVSPFIIQFDKLQKYKVKQEWIDPSTGRVLTELDDFYDKHYSYTPLTIELDVNGKTYSLSSKDDSIVNCDLNGSCTVAPIKPCISWGSPLIQTDTDSPSFFNVDDCMSQLGNYFSSLSFNNVSFSGIPSNPDSCHQLSVIGSWINRPDEVLCANVPQYVRRVVTPILSMILSMIVLRWLIKRGDERGV